MYIIKKTLLLSLIVLVSFKVKGVTCVSLGNGNWTNALNWSCGAVPNCGDSIVILAGHTVTITTQQNYTGCGLPIKITIYGTLKFTNGNKLLLPCGSKVYIMSGGSIDPGTGGGNSNTIEICNDLYWNAGSGTLGGPSCLPPCGPLPIELIHFKGAPYNTYVKLEWATMTETNNKLFIIERSEDADNFEQIGLLNGAGNSQTLKKYNFFDKKSLNEVVYYRLKQIDFDNSFEYSGIIAVKIKLNNEIKTYPNPAQNQITIEFNTTRFDEELMVNIMDLTGKKIKNITIKTAQNISTYNIDLSSIQQGFYFFQVIQQSGEIFQTKIIKN
jgi:hypothetical protein